MYLPSNIHKGCIMFLGDQLYIKLSNSYEKALEILDNHLKDAMQNGRSCIKDSKDFIKKRKHLKNIPNNTLCDYIPVCLTKRV